MLRISFWGHLNKKMGDVEIFKQGDPLGSLEIAQGPELRESGRKIKKGKMKTWQVE